MLRTLTPKISSVWKLMRQTYSFSLTTSTQQMILWKQITWPYLLTTKENPLSNKIVLINTRPR